MTWDLSVHQLDSLPEKVFNEEIDREIVKGVAGHRLGTQFLWSYHTKSESPRVVDLKTDRPELTPEQYARLMRLATLRSVDSYFHKIRNNLRSASRPVLTPDSNGLTSDRQFPLQTGHADQDHRDLPLPPQLDGHAADDADAGNEARSRKGADLREGSLWRVSGATDHHGDSCSTTTMSMNPTKRGSFEIRYDS